MKITVDALNSVLERKMPFETFDYNFFVSVQNSYIFFATPKVASSTLKKTLKYIELEQSVTRSDVESFFGNIHANTKYPFLSPFQLGLQTFCDMLNDTSVAKFAFVRNPYTRVLSAFLNKMSYLSKEKKKVVESLGVDVNLELSFKDFLSVVESTPLCQMDHHWRPQSDQILMNFINYNFIGSFENFNSDFNYIVEKLYGEKRASTNDSMMIKNVNEHATSASNKLELYYNNEIKSLVEHIYAKDFCDFNYSRELPLQTKT